MEAVEGTGEVPQLSPYLDWGDGYRALTIQDPEGLDEIARDWLELWQTRGRANPFNHPAWIRAWIRHLGGRVRPLIIAWFQGDTLTGLAPFGTAPFGPWRRLVLLGSPMADYPDLLVDEDHFKSIPLLVQHLLLQNWNCLDFVDVSEHSPVLSALLEAFQKCGYSPTIKQASICPGVEITTDWEEYWTQKKSKTRYTINKKAKRLAQEQGPLEMETVGTGPEIKESLAEVSRVHAARWARQHTRTVFSDKRGRAFFSEALTGLAKEGIVRLHLLRAGSTLTAFCLSFVGDGVHYYYIPGFDQTFAKDSPGHLLLREIIQESHDQGLRLFDFMKGMMKSTRIDGPIPIIIL